MTLASNIHLDVYPLYWINGSNMKEHALDVNRLIASRVRELRLKHHLSLDNLAERSGVSRSMISVIERGESSPTAVILQKLAKGLEVPMASLFDTPEAVRKSPPHPVARFNDQPVWKDPDTGYVRRNVSPADAPQGLRIVDVSFPAGARVSFDSIANERPFYQQVWVLEGAMDIHMGTDRYRLRAGDCLAAQMDQLQMFHNPGRRAARYAVITVPKGKRARV